MAHNRLYREAKTALDEIKNAENQHFSYKQLLHVDISKRLHSPDDQKSPPSKLDSLLLTGLLADTFKSIDSAEQLAALTFIRLLKLSNIKRLAVIKQKNSPDDIRPRYYVMAVENKDAPDATSKIDNLPLPYYNRPGFWASSHSVMIDDSKGNLELRAFTLHTDANTKEILPPGEIELVADIRLNYSDYSQIKKYLKRLESEVNKENFLTSLKQYLKDFQPCLDKFKINLSELLIQIETKGPKATSIAQQRAAAQNSSSAARSSSPEDNSDDGCRYGKKAIGGLLYAACFAGITYFGPPVLKLASAQIALLLLAASVLACLAYCYFNRNNAQAEQARLGIRLV